MIIRTNRGRLYWVMGFLLLITLYSSLALEISPSEAISNVYVSEPHTASITLTNNQPFKIFNITFSSLEYFSFPIIHELNAGESIQYNFTILTDTSFDSQPFTSIASFLYEIDVPIDPKTYNISVTDSGFIPYDIIIYAGDSIKFKNNGTITHSITSSEWDHELTTGAEQTIQFNQVKDITYYCKFIHFTGNIHVKNRSLTEFAHNNEFDKTFKVNLQSSYKATNLSIEFPEKTNFTINWNGYDEGMLKITNTEMETAHNIHLSTNSDEVIIEFDENDFDLNPDQTNYVTFKVYPIVNRTEQTNKTYDVTIQLISENAGGTDNQIRVFIPYHEFSVMNETLSEWWAEMRAFCNENKNSSLCLTEPIIKYINQTRNATPIYRLNFTEQQLIEFLHNARENKDISTRLENQLKTDIATIIGMLSNVEKNSSLAYSIASETQKKAETRNTITLVIITLLILIGCGVAITFYALKYAKGKRAKSIAGLHTKKTDEY